MTFSLKHGIATIITGSSSPKFKRHPAAGQAIKHCAQVHVYVEETPDRVIYFLKNQTMFISYGSQCPSVREHPFQGHFDEIVEYLSIIVSV